MKIKKKLSMEKIYYALFFNWFPSFKEIALVKYSGGSDCYADQPLYPTYSVLQQQHQYDH
jgi:hypothetical protein